LLKQRIELVDSKCFMNYLM